MIAAPEQANLVVRLLVNCISDASQKPLHSLYDLKYNYILNYIGWIFGSSIHPVFLSTAM